MTYRYTRVRLNIRWIDYMRIRAVFPALRDESVSSYFTRLAMWLKENKK